MGQHISYCKTGADGSFEPHKGKRRLPGAPPSSLLFLTNDDNTALSRATASTGYSSPKTSVSPTSPLDTSSGTISHGNYNMPTFPDRDTNQLHQPLPLRYTTSTRNLQNQEASATTATTTHVINSHVDTYLPPLQHQHQHTRVQQVIRNHNHKGQQLLQKGGQPPDKRSNPVKFPRKRANVQHRNDTAHPNGSSDLQVPPQDSSYLERMYDSRTWEMYRRITTHREKLEAFNAANASAKQENDDDRTSTNRTYMSDPVQRVTNSSTMEGGVDYDNFYDPATEDDYDSRGGGIFLLEDHSAPPYHHHRQCDNGQQHHGCFNGQCPHTENYSEWEHMDGDDGETGKDTANTEGGHHETIFLFDF